MRSIQVQQKEQFLLMKSVSEFGKGNHKFGADDSGVMGAGPSSAATSSSPVPQHLSDGDTRPPCSLNPLLDTSVQHAAPDNKKPWLPKMDFPHFDGTDVRIWLDKCSSYFHIYSVPPNFRVTTSSMHMIDRAAYWFQSYKHSPGSHTWEHFVIAVSWEFEVNTHRVKTKALLNLRQTSSVEDYKHQFDKLVYHIQLYDQSISEMMMVSQFMLGLKDEIRHTVEMHLPQTVAQATASAEIQEHISEKKTYRRKFPTVKSDSKPSFSSTELWKA
jgi:hypothetical protein